MKRPPYARELIANRKAGRYVNPWLFAGRGAWELASRRGPGRLVLPDGADPSLFDWRMLAGLEVVVRWPNASMPQVDQLGALLVRAGARVVLALADLREDGDRILIMRPLRRFLARRKAA